jgi:flagellar secretion chaperone FliS
MRGTGIDAYRKTDVMTADSSRVILMCYEDAIRSLKDVKEFYAEGRFEAKGKALQRTLDIISGLERALDFKQGGEIAENLGALYNFLQRHLLMADLHRDLGAIDRAITMLEELEEAWKEILIAPKTRQIAEVTLPNRLHLEGPAAPSRMWSV